MAICAVVSAAIWTALKAFKSAASRALIWSVVKAANCVAVKPATCAGVNAVRTEFEIPVNALVLKFCSCVTVSDWAWVGCKPAVWVVVQDCKVLLVSFLMSAAVWEPML